MKNELPKLLQIFYTIPWWLSFFLMGFLLMFGVIASATDATLSKILVTLGIVSFIFFLGSYHAANKIAKLRLGYNPRYYVQKAPKDLVKQMQALQKDGFQLVSQTATTANVQRRPRFSWLTFLLLLLLGVVLGVVYLVWYFLQDMERVILDTSTQGEVQTV